jgi:hypothetical protein
MNDNETQPPNLNLIQMVQRARMQNDATALPSRANAGYWIEAKRKSDGPGPTPRAGHWVIPTTLDAIDELWTKIRAATEAGQLGYKARVSTRPPRDPKGPQTAPTNDRVIYVCTYDACDGEDVGRVQAGLARLGVKESFEYQRITEENINS